MVVIAAALVVVACAPPALPISGGDSLAGCYRLRVGSWERRDLQRIHSLPREFELLRDVGEHGDGLVRPVLPPPQHNHSVAHWRPVGGDSVRIWWTVGFEGMALSMRVYDTELRGSASASSDVINVDEDGNVVMPRADASARRVACAANRPR